MADCNIKYASSIILLTFISLHASCNSHYTPLDNIVLSCGFSGSPSVSIDNRIWVGDVNSNFFPLDFHRNNDSKTQNSSPSDYAPYLAARLSHFQFTYFFTVTPGQKFVRLHFYTDTNTNTDTNKAVFSVKAGPFTLLRDFNVSAYSDVVRSNSFFREYCVNVEGNNRTLNITFTPSSEDLYAVISGIEIVSMPVNLYYTQPEPHDQGGRGMNQIGHDNKRFPIENYTSLEMVYRMNICGELVSPVHDTGMFRTWSRESNLSDEYLDDACPTNFDIHLNHIRIPAYSAPDTVYQSARTMGPNDTRNKSYNLTWVYPVDPGFFYMIRLHFCEFQEEINDTNERVFLIYIANTIAETSADVFGWAGGKGIPYYRDYAVNMPPNNGEMKVNLSVTLQANPEDWRTRFTNVILNGIEIFKLNDSSGDLAGQNPDPPPTLPLLPPTPQSRKSDRKMVGVLIPAVVGGVTATLALGLFVFCRRRTFSDQTSSDGTSWWAPYSISTNKSSKTRNSNLPSDLCRYFSLAEIKSATKNFDDIFIIGVGGFGNVYKGYVDDGATQVAIKRLKPGSKQGAHEFKTEIETLSQLRHLHLVSLIGYCNEGNEMILVYDYMSHGTLRSHLYGDDEQPLTWNQRLQTCIGAARGLHYLHTGAEHTIIHRDVKTTNILLDDKWVAKVSDFGLSKIGPTNMSNAHISTVVKGSFGYLDPEYCRRRQLSEKSDVYSFGVVLCEVLRARTPIIHTVAHTRVLLTEWVKQCIYEKKVTEMVDPILQNQIGTECFRKFVQVMVSCIQDEGNKRPSMNDVVRGLEYAYQLQESSKEDNVELSSLDNEDGWLLREGMSSNTSIEMNENSSNVYNNGMSGIVSSLQAR